MHHVQVGGDGLFQEILNGLLAIRGNGGQAGQVAAHLRPGPYSCRCDMIVQALHKFQHYSSP